MTREDHLSIVIEAWSQSVSPFVKLFGKASAEQIVVPIEILMKWRNWPHETIGLFWRMYIYSNFPDMPEWMDKAFLIRKGKSPLKYIQSEMLENDAKLSSPDEIAQFLNCPLDYSI